jgi:hypothetical protein
MLLKVVIILSAVIAAALVALVVAVALHPFEFRIARAATISAPLQSVFAQVNDFRKWVEWSPWEKLDPAMKRTYEGPPAGEGAVYAWSGNGDVGEGRTTITESRPCELIKMRLDFLRPFEVTNQVEFAFRPEANGTAVTWSMSGRNGFLCKAVGLFMNMDRMVGGQFEKGLAQLKAVVEAAPQG